MNIITSVSQKSKAIELRHRGLSLSHIDAFETPEGYYLRRNYKIFMPRNSLLNVVKVNGSSSGMSKDSRLRLIRETEKLEYYNQVPTHMLTLTLQSWNNTLEYARKWSCAKRKFLKMLSRWILRNNGGYLWFQEFQKRGAPHLHILLRLSPLSKKEWQATLDTFIKMWRSALGYQIPSQSVDFSRMRKKDFRYARAYASKSLQKKAPFEYSWGHWWGVGGTYKKLPTFKEVISRKAVSELLTFAKSSKSIASMVRSFLAGNRSSVWIAHSIVNSVVKSGIIEVTECNQIGLSKEGEKSG